MEAKKELFMYVVYCDDCQCNLGGAGSVFSALHMKALHYVDHQVRISEMVIA